MNWKEDFDELLPGLGHRNWVIVADAAFPQQTAPGIKTLVSGQEHLEVLEYVWQKLKEAPHVHPEVIFDAEFSRLSESDKAGAEGLLVKVCETIDCEESREVWHDDLLQILEEQGKLYTMLFIKTTSEIPYSSVFFNLGCGYWSANQEDSFRKRLQREG